MVSLSNCLAILVFISFLPSHSAIQLRKKAGSQLRTNETGDELVQLHVGFAVFVTDIGTEGWRDALYVLAHGVRQAAAKSRHSIELVALVPEEMPREQESILIDAGFKQVLRKRHPVELSEMSDGFFKEHMSKNNGRGEFTFAQLDETIKYWGMALMQYDRVLVIDADVMVLDPMDELMEQQEYDFIGTYDHGLDIDGSTMAPVQGGFLLFRPSQEDFEAVKALTREGSWSGAGWNNSGIGYCYGGVGPDGLLAYYYNKDAIDEISQIGKESLAEGLGHSTVTGSRMIAVDRSKYDVVLNERLEDELESASHDGAIADVSSVHFTGNCIKPWECMATKHWLCDGLTEKWWELRVSLEQERDLEPTKRCETGHFYEPLKLPSV